MTAVTEQELADFDLAFDPAPTPRAHGGYEGARQLEQSLLSWNPADLAPDVAIARGKRLADSRAQDTLRNDAYMASGSDILRDSIVGSHFRLNAKPNFKVLGLSEAWAEEFQEEVEAKFNLYAESPENWIDAQRRSTLTGLVRLAVAVHLAHGEVLGTAEWIREFRRPYNTAIQMISPSRLSNPDGVPDSPRLRQGVELNRWGAPVAAHIRQAHPSEYWDQAAYTWKRVPWRKPWGRLQVLHVLEQGMPGQNRGITQMVTALKEMRMTKRFRDVVLQQAVLSATYAASIESEMPPEAVHAALGGGTGFAQALDPWMSALAEYAAGAKGLNIDGVKIPHLFPGTKMKINQAGDPKGVGTNFEQSLLRHIASSLGVSYEQLSKDYSSTNYSSARAAAAETEKHMRARKKMVADRFASLIYRLWFEEAMNKGEIESLPANAPNPYEGQNLDAYTASDWIGAHRGQIDELKETQAAALRIKYNLSTHEKEAARLGEDYRDVLRQRGREQRMLDAEGLTSGDVSAEGASPEGTAPNDTAGDTSTGPEE